MSTTYHQNLMCKEISNHDLKVDPYLIQHISKKKQTQDQYNIVLEELEDYTKDSYCYLIKKLNHDFQTYDHAVKILLNTGSTYKILKHYISVQLYLDALDQVEISRNHQFKKYSPPPIPQEYKSLDVFEKFLQLAFNENSAINNYRRVFVPIEYRTRDHYLRFIELNPFVYFHIKNHELRNDFNIKSNVINRLPKLIHAFHKPEFELIIKAKKLGEDIKRYVDHSTHLTPDQIEYLRLL